MKELMKLFVLYEYDRDIPTVVGIYETEEAAKKGAVEKFAEYVKEHEYSRYGEWSYSIAEIPMYTEEGSE